MTVHFYEFILNDPKIAWFYPPPRPNENREKLFGPNFQNTTFRKCGHVRKHPNHVEFEHSDSEGSFKLPSRALNWQKSNISFLILNNLTFGFYFFGNNNPIVLEQLNSEFEFLRVGYLGFES